MPARTKKKHVEFTLCVTDSEPDLQKGKFYKVLPDDSAYKNKHLRVVDDSGEDYLYPAHFFMSIKLPDEARKVLSRAS